jgi:uncharacterized protein (DUF4415 family)
MPRKKRAGSPSFGKPLTDDPDDAPEVLNEFFRTGEITRGHKVIRRGRPPLGDKPKGSVTLRLDADVLETYRALGKGWQAQLNADLRRARRLKKSA